MTHWPPEKITQWGLQQNDSVSIGYAFAALRDLLLQDQNTNDREATIDGLAAIQQKLIDRWPGYSVDVGDRVLTGADADTNRREAIRLNYERIAKPFDTPKFQGTVVAAYLRIEPQPGDAEAHAVWRDVGTRYSLFGRNVP